MTIDSQQIWFDLIKEHGEDGASIHYMLTGI